MARIAVLIPCFNEAISIGQVVRDFHRELPRAEIYVFDNGSTDDTRVQAARAGAVVISEPRRGKGHVVQAMIRQIDADIYVLVDGDDTYPAAQVHALLEPILRGDADMVVGSRLQAAGSDFRPLNRLGNHLFVRLLNFIFGAALTDVFSGFRALSRSAIKGLPLFVTGFEIEAELTIKALERGYRIHEAPTRLTARSAGSHSKLKRVRDGLRILGTILLLARDYKPFTFFGTAGAGLVLAGLLPGLGVVAEFARTGLVPRLPTALLAVGLVVSGLLSATAGLVLHALNRRFQELDYLIRTQLDVPRETRAPFRSRVSPSGRISLAHGARRMKE